MGSRLCSLEKGQIANVLLSFTFLRRQGHGAIESRIVVAARIFFLFEPSKEGSATSLWGFLCCGLQSGEIRSGHHTTHLPSLRDLSSCSLPFMLLTARTMLTHEEEHSGRSVVSGQQGGPLSLGFTEYLHMSSSTTDKYLTKLRWRCICAPDFHTS